MVVVKRKVPLSFSTDSLRWHSRGGSRGGMFGGQDPQTPCWGTPKLHKEGGGGGGNVARVYTNLLHFST